MNAHRIERNLNLLGLATKEVISLGPGYRDWPLMAFRGPVFSGQRIWGIDAPSRTCLLLPKDLLALLYSRFSSANPQGVAIAETGELDDLEFGPEVKEIERERRYDAGEVGWDVFDHRTPPHGTDPIRRYLPELFDPAAKVRILADPTLDTSWLRPNQPGPEYQLGWDERQHYRWSEWWLRAGHPPTDRSFRPPWWPRCLP